MEVTCLVFHFCRISLLDLWADGSWIGGIKSELYFLGIAQWESSSSSIWISLFDISHPHVWTKYSEIDLQLTGINACIVVADEVIIIGFDLPSVVAHMLVFRLCMKRSMPPSFIRRQSCNTESVTFLWRIIMYVNTFHLAWYGDCILAGW